MDETDEMCIQPNNSEYEVNIYGGDVFNWDRTLLFSNEFHGSIAGLTLSKGNGPLNTPELLKANPFLPPNLESFDDPKDDICKADFQDIQTIERDEEVSAAFDNEDEHAMAMILAMEAENNAMYLSPIKDMDAETAIALIKDELHSLNNEVSNDAAIEPAMPVINPHPHAGLSMHNHPVAQHRFRYRSDGIRYLEESRQNPMTIGLLGLAGYSTNPAPSFGILLTIVTTQNNPTGKIYVHQHELSYNSTDAQQNGLHSVLVPITEQEIHQGHKRFPRLSMIKTRLNEYEFELVPFDLSGIIDQVDLFTLPNENKLTKKQKSKKFDQFFDTDSYQIVCQLMVKQNDQWFPTDVYCQTHTITHTNK